MGNTIKEVIVSAALCSAISFAPIRAAQRDVMNLTRLSCFSVIIIFHIC